MTMQQQNSKRQAVVSRPNNLFSSATAAAATRTSISSSSVGLRTPPSNRVVLMKRENGLGELQEQSGGRGDAESFQQESKRYAERTAPAGSRLRGQQSINVHAEDEFPPLMSPASSAVSSPQKAGKVTERRQQQQSEIVRAGGRGILNMLKRDGLLNETAANDKHAVVAADEYTKPRQRYGLASSTSLSRENRLKSDDRAHINSSISYGKQHYYNSTDQILNNSSTDSAYFTTVGSKQNNNCQLYNNTGDHASENGYGPQQSATLHRSANVSRKSSVGRKYSADAVVDEDDAMLHDLDESERITEKLSTAQARIKQQINAKVEYEKQQRLQQLNGINAVSIVADRKPSVGSQTTSKSDSVGVLKPLPAAAKIGASVAGVIKLTKPIFSSNIVPPHRDVPVSAVKAARLPNPPPVRRFATSILHSLSDPGLKDKYLPKPQCLINHNLDWQEAAQKLLLREYLDEQNEMFTVIAVCGPQSSGKSTILSCLGIQSMGNFHLFDHDAALVSPAQRQTSSINLYINAKQRVILLDSPGMLSTQLLAELMCRPTRPPPLFNGDKMNNVAGVHVYLEHQAEVYAYQLAAFLFAVSHVVLFCNDHMPIDYCRWVMDFLHKTCILKPPVLNIDLQNPLCGVVNVDEMLALRRAEQRAKRLAEKAERLASSTYGRPRGAAERRLASSSVSGAYYASHPSAARAVKESIADHWPNLYFIVNKACDSVAFDCVDQVSGSTNSAGGLKLCSVPDDRVRLEKSLKSLVGSTPLGRATRVTDKLRISSTTSGAARSDEEKWPKLAYEDCQLFVVPFVGHQRKQSQPSNDAALQPEEAGTIGMNGEFYASVNTVQSIDYDNDGDEDFGDEEYNPALRFIFDDNLTLSHYSNKAPTLSPVPEPPSTTTRRAGILTGVKLMLYDTQRPDGGVRSSMFDRFSNIRSAQQWQPANYSTRSSFYRRPRAGLISRAPSSHVCRHAHYRGGGVEQAFYTDLSNVEKFIVEKQPKKLDSVSSFSAEKSGGGGGGGGTVTWKDVLANKQAYETIARLRRTCFNAPTLPITPGVRMSEKQWLRYASAMWSHIKSDSCILNYARAINMASSSTMAAGT